MTAIMGGTFDPVHIGHLRAAQEVLEFLQLEDFRFLPAGQPPHRSDVVTSARHRLAMLELALQEQSRFTIDEREIRRQGPSYMVDTLADLRREMPGRALLLVIGQDSANSLTCWHRWQELFELTHLVIMQRPDHPDRYPSALAGEIAARTVAMPGALAERRHGRVLGVEVTQLQISSSAIRNLVRAGRSARFLVPDAVRHYMQSENLYR